MAFDLDSCISTLLRKQLLGEALLKEICEKTKELLMREGNVVHISAPVTVVGDIHGQFYDLIEIFRIGGYSPHTNYLFLGDYVDRGLFSVETISLLTCLKLRYPDRVQLIRGNHESRAVTQVSTAGRQIEYQGESLSRRTHYRSLIPTDIRFLHRMYKKVWRLNQSLAVLHRHV